MPIGGLFNQKISLICKYKNKFSDSAYQSADVDEFGLLKTFLLLESLFLFLVKVDYFDALLIHEPPFFDLEFLVSLK